MNSGRPWTLAVAALAIAGSCFVLLSVLSPISPALMAAGQETLGEVAPALYSDFNGDGFADLMVAALWEGLGPSQRAGVLHVIYGTAAGLSADGNQLWHQDVPGVSDSVESNDWFGEEMDAGDFNADGFADLVIGVPREVLGGLKTGAFHVLPGSVNGAATVGEQFWHLGSPGILGDPSGDDWFGEELHVGDFDGDGFQDLAVSAPFEIIDQMTNAGGVHILYGSPAGLTAAGNQFLHQNSPGIRGVVEQNDMFGEELAGGDFNGDGFDDLAVGALHESIFRFQSAGVAHVIYGSPTGLTPNGNQLFHQATPGVPDQIETRDLFGHELGAGDFDGDGFDELVIGVKGEDLDGIANAGAVTVLRGSADGVITEGSLFITQTGLGVVPPANDHSFFGVSLDTGDFNGDGFEDLIIGSAKTAIGNAEEAGFVCVIYGSAQGLALETVDFWHQDTPGIEDQAETEDKFGWEVRASDFNGDGFTDLVIGVNEEDLGAAVKAGMAHVLYGSPAGLTPSGSQIWHQDSPGIQEEAESDDIFGQL